MRRFCAGAVLVVLVLAAQVAYAADDASAGYESIRPSLVKVWAFDRDGKPAQSGTGIVVTSGDRRSEVLTATHIVTGASAIRVDLSRDLHDLTARVERTGPRDLTLLSIDRGGLHPARFAPRSRPVVEGNLVAVAGYVKMDELIGVVGQAPRVLFPGTIASRPQNGMYLELENVHIEEGLSGGAVFDPTNGDVLGIVTARTSDRRGGFADSGALVVLPFLQATPVAARAATPAPALPLLALEPPALPQETLRAGMTLALPAPAPVPAPAPAPTDSGVTAWQAARAQPKRFVYERAGCRIAVTIDINSLEFAVAHEALVQPRRRGAMLDITLEQRPAATEACGDVPDGDPTEAAYEPTAMSFDGHHVTMRFVYAGDPDASTHVPGDASLDADLDGTNVTATVQFFDRNWTGSIALPLTRSTRSAISSTW